MDRVRILAAVLQLSVLTVACGGAGMTAYTPVNEKTPFDEDALFNATETSFDRLGYQPVGRDRNAYSIKTREKEVGYSSVPRRFYRYSFHVRTEDGKLSISAECKINSAVDRESFDECGDDERPRRVIEEQETLAKTILELAAKKR